MVLLFVLVFINDLPEVVAACMKLFADDAKMFGRVNFITETIQRSFKCC